MHILRFGVWKNCRMLDDALCTGAHARAHTHTHTLTGTHAQELGKNDAPPLARACGLG